MSSARRNAKCPLNKIHSRRNLRYYDHSRIFWRLKDINVPCFPDFPKSNRKENPRLLHLHSNLLTTSTSYHYINPNKIKHPPNLPNFTIIPADRHISSKLPLHLVQIAKTWICLRNKNPLVGKASMLNLPKKKISYPPVDHFSTPKIKSLH